MNTVELRRHDEKALRFSFLATFATFATFAIFATFASFATFAIFAIFATFAIFAMLSVQQESEHECCFTGEWI